MNTYSRDNQGFDWGSFIAGILMVIVSFVLLRHPGQSLKALVLLFAILSILQGIVWIAGYARFKDIFSYSWLTIVSGIIDIIIGVCFLGSYEVGGFTLAYLFAIWFFVDSIVGIVFSWRLRSLSTGMFIFNLIMNILCLLISIFLIFNPIVAMISLVWFVAFWLLAFGINQIIISWVHR